MRGWGRGVVEIGQRLRHGERASSATVRRSVEKRRERQIQIRRTLVGTVKDEGPYLLEWLCYYKLIGFDQRVIASNDCSDGTHEMLSYLDEIGEVVHIENSRRAVDEPADPQNRAYQRIWRLPSVRESDWVLVADADEFLNIHTGDGTLDALLLALERATDQRVDLISASWRVFGTSEIAAFVDDLVTDQFTRAAPLGTYRIQRYTAFKTLARPRVIKQLGVHRPRLAPRFRNGMRDVLWVNGSGKRLPDRYLNQGWRFFSDSYGADLVTMNHYMVKSAEAFLAKRYRGTANSANAERIDFDYFDTFNANAETDTRISQHVPALRGVIAALKAAHPVLARLHADSLAWHRKKLTVAKEELCAQQPQLAKRLGLEP